ncbi:MAG TPA: tRNA glutamyl-Q(34) synthetase GluQRS [Planctomycetota bacterium]|nr:tRNA glutamyl-Q(34) synthetase GluQRS [Planctomycetota bacterium]
MAAWTTRFAPSPTGALHLGNARTLGLAWWWARAEGAGVVLRIEDLDHPRKKAGAIEQLREDLAWLGLDYDRETPIQTSRLERHLAALDALVALGLVYGCACSRKDLEEAQSAPHEIGDEPPYPGTCRGRFATPRDAALATGRPAALRFLAAPGVERFDDLLAGPQEIDPALHGGDFVVGRLDVDGARRPAYQLAVVVDDADDGVDRVIRGADLLRSAARQRRLQRALGLPPTTYAHAPLVVGRDGRRLAKRHGDTRLASLRARGISAQAVWDWIARSCGAAPAAPADLVRRGFRPDAVPREPATPPEAWAEPPQRGL